MSHNPETRFRNTLSDLEDARRVLCRLLDQDDSHRWDMLPLSDPELNAVKDLYTCCMRIVWSVNANSTLDYDFIQQMSTDESSEEANIVIDRQHKFFVDKANAEQDELDRQFEEQQKAKL